MPKKILKMKTTYVERSNTNEEVLRRANEQLKDNEKIKLLSLIFLERKQTFFCKVMTADETDPIRTITFVGGGARPREHHPRRVGRPKHKWVVDESRRVWETIQSARPPQVPYDIKSPAQGH